MLDDKKINQLIKENKLKTLDDVNTLLKGFSKKLVEAMLESELTDHLGYEKHSTTDKKTDNSRNGHSAKRLNSKFGQIGIEVPRDRKASFSPIIVPKGSRNLGSIEENVLMMYSRGMSERDISDYFKEIYNYKLSAQTVSNLISRITEEVTNWQNRPLQKIYAIVFLDAIVYKIKRDGMIKNVAVYSMMGINMSGNKEVIGLWVGESESSKYWLRLLNELKTRGVRDILICCVDGLNGFSEAIKAVYPSTDVQRCMVHQVRNSLKFVPYKYKKEIARDLKSIYQSVSEESAKNQFDKFAKKWDHKYPYISKSWRENWSELMTYYKYPVEIRKMIYTTNSIENYHRSLRKVTKSKPIFPSDKSLLKLLFLVTKNITVKWTMPMKKWGQIYSQLQILFEDRIENVE